MTERNRLVAVVVEVADLARSARLYREGFGVDLKAGDNRVDDRWIGGEHAELSWVAGAYLHFALYQAKEQPTTRVQLAFVVDDLDEAHTAAVSAGAEVVHEARDQPWGRSARYRDLDGNVIELSQRP
jgi:predicted enzyme related to lactoylglutathione lyase